MSQTHKALEIHSDLVMKGELSMAQDVILTGKFEGELKTDGCLTVSSGGVAIGTIEAGALVLQPGNLVEARVKIAPPANPATASGQPWAAHEEAQPARGDVPALSCGAK